MPARIALCTALLFALLSARAAAQQPTLPVPALPTVVAPGIVPTTGPAPGAYQENDAGGFHDVLPSGTRGRYNAAELGAFLTTGATVPHCCDQLPMYANLVYATPGLKAEDIPKYFKDSSFGVPANGAESTYSPRSDVTIVRDKAFGVPHVYGATRAGAMFGLGYAGAEDRLFFMDVLRHAGRGELAGFAGGANAAMDREQWEVAPYTEQDLQRQVDDLPKYLGAQGTQIVADAQNYVAGVNEYIAEATLDPTKLPGEYAAIGKTPQPFVPADIIAIASLVGGIFGKGGGEELQFSQLADALERRFGKHNGDKAFNDFRAAEDPEAPVTVFDKRFPYQVNPQTPAKRSVARPDPGSLKLSQTGSTRSIFPGFPARASNALLVSGKESQSGHPLAVMGPQVGYFNPQILMEEDVHAPDSAAGPGIDAQGAAFVGINLYVQLGRGRDYAWSATSAGQDIIDTFALPLCDDTHYRYRGRCEPIEVLQKTVSWTPNLGDQTAPGSQTLKAERTKLGIVAGRGTVRGTPMIFTKLRSTYFHEVDSAAGFMDFNTPSVIRDPASFQHAASKIGYTFNWFYADADHIAYFNSGNNPERAKGVDNNFPVAAEYEWRGWNPGTWQARFTPPAQHPQAVDQAYLVNWNNKQARGYRSSDANAYSSTYRTRDARGPRQAGDRGREEDDVAAADRRDGGGGHDRPARVGRPPARAARPRQPEGPGAARTRSRSCARGAPTAASGATRTGTAPTSTQTPIRIMDAWWPRWVKAEFQPTLGKHAFHVLTATVAIDNTPNGNGDHLGSSYQGSFYGYVSKDLRTTLGEQVRGPYSRRYCGSLAKCRAALTKSLKAALNKNPYTGDPLCKDGDQWCYDAVRQRPTGGATQPLIEWINRPTFQQANEILKRLPR